ncbi:hypothetical protein [Xenorhabdus sp. IM139775]|uniref:hypothetical protein n=1 Tax=Xenorhabdus sp. IM139775 TaxID=3025876 RepID=UPI002358F7F5|nr:hypothetical protein [Xenorhabdus sp. IM139775]
MANYQTAQTTTCWIPAGANPSFIATQMGHVSSQMAHHVHGAWMNENSDDQIKLFNEKLTIAPYMPQEIKAK